MYGNDWAGDKFSTSIRKLHPQTFFYRTWKRDRTWRRDGNKSDFQQLNLKDLFESGLECVILQVYKGAPFKRGYLDQLGVKIEPIFEGKTESIYRVISLKGV